MKFAIRDDDLSYWTSVDEIETLYGPYFQKGVKISFATIPNSYRLYDGGDRTKFHLGDEKHPIYENTELVEYIKEKINHGNAEIMLHGYDHSYCILQDGKNVFLNKDVREQVGETKDLVFVPECIHKTDEQLKIELQEGKDILEDTFGVRIKMFVPPSNALRAGAVRVVENLGMNISGTMLPEFNRDLDIYSVSVYLKKLLWRLKNKQISYPYIMSYKGHKELTGYAFTPKTDWERLGKQLEYCREKVHYGTIATHYWEALENEQLRVKLYQLLDEIVKRDEKTVGLSRIFE